jgi:hypothetical protein
MPPARSSALVNNVVKRDDAYQCGKGLARQYWLPNGDMQK